LDEGRQDIRQNHDAIISTAVKITGMPLATAEETFKLVVFPPLRNNVTSGNPMSMCNASKGQGIGSTLDQARDFYRQSGQIKTPASYDDFLNPAALSAAFGVKCP
jgi:hypothetical protein